MVQMKVPCVRVYVGKPSEIFSMQDLASGYHLDHRFADVWDQTLIYKGGVELLKDVGLVTLKSTQAPENTRLSTSDTHMDTHAADFATAHKTTTAPLTTWKGTSTAQFWCSASNGGISKFSVPCTTPFSWKEVFLDRRTPCVRLGQTKSTPWVVSQLVSDTTFIQNPDIYIEIERKMPPGKQVSATNLSGREQAPDGTSKSVTVPVGNPLLNVILGYNTASEYNLLFVDNQAPTCIRTSDMQYVTASGGNIVMAENNAPLYISIRHLPTGALYITSNMLTKPWIVTMPNSASKSEEGSQFTYQPAAINIPAGRIAVAFAGYGICNFALGQIRYPSCTYTEDDVVSSGGGVMSSGWIDRGAAFDPDKYVCSTEVKGYYPKPDKYTKSPAFSKIVVEEHPTDETHSKFRYVTGLWTNDDRYTPYLSRGIVHYPAQTLKTPLEIPVTSGVKSLTLTPSLEKFKVKVSGNITFTNFNGEWTDTPIQQGIRIYFAWRTITGYDELNNAIFGNDEPFTPIFTGFLIKPSLDRQAFTASYASFELQDRWKQLSDAKVVNSPFYDGANWCTAFKDMCSRGGVSEEDIAIDSEIVQEAYCLPKPPNSLLDPKFKRKFGSTWEQSVDEIHDLVMYFIAFDGEGKLKVKKISSIFANEESVVFYDHITEAIKDDPDALRLAANPKLSIDSDQVYNWIIAMGPREDLNGPSPADWAVAVDWDSIDDETARNYIGYQKIATEGRLYYMSKRDLQDAARRLLTRASTPPEDVTWQCPGNTLALFTPVQFDVDTTRTGILLETKYWLVANSFRLEGLKCESSMQAKLIRGMM